MTVLARVCAGAPTDTMRAPPRTWPRRGRAREHLGGRRAYSVSNFKSHVRPAPTLSPPPPSPTALGHETRYTPRRVPSGFGGMGLGAPPFRRRAGLGPRGAQGRPSTITPSPEEGADAVRTLAGRCTGGGGGAMSATARGLALAYGHLSLSSPVSACKPILAECARAPGVLQISPLADALPVDIWSPKAAAQSASDTRIRGAARRPEHPEYIGIRDSG
ncbi:hypothetical protein BC628DRAFT_81498 [Trametes gibbosa]|nr:hypothetical protein BC628DRAFT_81498 [Trametes gibbosa]